MQRFVGRTTQTCLTFTANEEKGNIRQIHHTETGPWWVRTDIASGLPAQSSSADRPRVPQSRLWRRRRRSSGINGDVAAPVGDSTPEGAWNCSAARRTKTRPSGVMTVVGAVSVWPSSARMRKQVDFSANSAWRRVTLFRWRLVDTPPWIWTPSRRAKVPDSWPMAVRRADVSLGALRM